MPPVLELLPNLSPPLLSHPLACFGRLRPLRRSRLDLDCRYDGLGQSIEHVGPKRTRAFEKVAEYEDIQANFRGDLLERPGAMMNRSAEMPGKRILRGRLVEHSAAVGQFGKFGSNFLAIEPQLLHQARGDVLCRSQSSPCGDQAPPRGVSGGTDQFETS